MSVLLFDIGGTNLRMAVGEKNKEADAISNVQKIPTPPDPHEAVSELIKFTKGSVPQLTAASGAVAGVIEKGIVQVSPHLPEWKGFEFAKTLSDALAVPAQIVNDAEAAGLGEATFGAGKDYSLVAYIGIGTGVGGSLIVDRKVALHAHGFEPGRLILNTADGTTLEQLISGSSLEKRFGKAPKDLPPEVYKELTLTLAIGLHNVILEWSPEVLVLGGSLMNETNGFRLADVQQSLSALPGLTGMLPVLARSTLGDENGLYGALASGTS